MSVPSGTFGDYGALITNAGAVTTEKNNYEVCQRSGIKAPAGKLIREWSGLYVRPKDADDRNPQDFVRAVKENLTPTPNPERSDTFVATNEVTADDL